MTPGYWRNEEATRAAFTRGRLADLGRPRPARRRRLLLDRRAAQGDVHLGRRERLSGRGRERALRPSGGRRRGGARRGGPEMGRGRPRLRPARAGRRRVPRRAELQAFCRARLAPYKVPRRFDFVAEFPRTSAGKIQKHLLALGPCAKPSAAGSRTDGTHEPAASRIGPEAIRRTIRRLADNRFIWAWKVTAGFTVLVPDAARGSSRHPADHRRTKAMPRTRSDAMMVGERGFEPPAPASRRQCSTRLSYSPTDARGPRERAGGAGRL